MGKRNITYLLATSIFLLTLSICLGQEASKHPKQVDSLNAILRDPNISDTSKVNSLINLANYYYLQNPDTAIIICKKAEVLSEKNDYLKGMSESYGWLGYLVSLKGDMDQAINYTKKSLDIANRKNVVKDQATILSNLGALYEKTVKYLKL